MTIENAFQLLDEYNNPGISDIRSDTIVEQLYHAGYVIRPLHTIIIKDEVQSEVLNAGSRQWGLVDRSTRLPVTRPEQKGGEPTA